MLILILYCLISSLRMCVYIVIDVVLLCFVGLGSAEEGTTAPKSGSSGGGATPSKSRGGGSGGGALSQALSTPPGGVQAAATAAAPAAPASKGPGFYTQASPGHSWTNTPPAPCTLYPTHSETKSDQRGECSSRKQHCCTNQISMSLLM